MLMHNSRAVVSLHSGLGFRVSGLGFRVSGLGFRVSGLGFRVSGLGLVEARKLEHSFRRISARIPYTLP